MDAGNEINAMVDKALGEVLTKYSLYEVLKSLGRYCGQAKQAAVARQDWAMQNNYQNVGSAVAEAIRGWDDDEPEEDEKEECAVCGDALEEGNGDNWHDLCPGCADQVSACMDAKGLDEEHGRDEAMEAVRNGWAPGDEEDSAQLPV